MSYIIISLHADAFQKLSRACLLLGHWEENGLLIFAPVSREMPPHDFCAHIFLCIKQEITIMVIFKNTFVFNSMWGQIAGASFNILLMYIVNGKSFNY